MQSNGNIYILNMLNVDCKIKAILFVEKSFEVNKPQLLSQTRRLKFYYLPVCLLCIKMPEDSLSTSRIAWLKCEGNLVD